MCVYNVAQWKEHRESEELSSGCGRAFTGLRVKHLLALSFLSCERVD